MPPSDFQNFFEVATGPCKNAVNLACGDFLSSLFSLLSFLCSLPSSLLGTDPFRSHPAGPMAPRDLIWDLSRPHLGISGGLFWHLFSLLSSLFSLLSSRFSLRSSLFSLLSPPVSLLSSLSALFPLLSSLSALFPLLSLLLLSQIPLRTCPFELRIRPSIPLPIHSTLCLTIPGPGPLANPVAVQLQFSCSFFFASASVRYRAPIVRSPCQRLHATDQELLTSSHPSLLSLLLLSQISLRTCPFELRIRPSIPLPIHSTLCLTIPGPA